MFNYQLDNQRWLVELLKELGYQNVSSVGVCHGYAMLARQAALLGQLTQFSTRVERLREMAKSGEFQRLVKEREARLKEGKGFTAEKMRLFASVPQEGKEEIKEEAKAAEDNVFYWDAFAFLDSVYLYHHPKEVLSLGVADDEDLVFHPSRIAARNLVAPPALSGVTEVVHLAGVYDLADLTKYLIALQETLVAVCGIYAGDVVPPIVINLASPHPDHVMTLSYNFTSKKFLLIDSGGTAQEVADVGTLAKELRMVFRIEKGALKPEEPLLLRTTVVIADKPVLTEKKKEEAKEKKEEDKKKQGEAIRLLQAWSNEVAEGLTTSAKESYRTPQDRSLFSEAVLVGDINTAKKLLSYGADANSVLWSNRLRGVEMAMYNNDAAMLEVLLQHNADPTISYAGRTLLEQAKADAKKKALVPLLEKAMTIHAAMRHHGLQEKDVISPRYQAIQKMYHLQHTAEDEKLGSACLADFVALDRLITALMAEVAAHKEQGPVFIAVEMLIDRLYQRFWDHATHETLEQIFYDEVSSLRRRYGTNLAPIDEKSASDKHTTQSWQCAGVYTREELESYLNSLEAVAKAMSPGSDLQVSYSLKRFGEDQEVIFSFDAKAQQWHWYSSDSDSEVKGDTEALTKALLPSLSPEKKAKEPAYVPLSVTAHLRHDASVSGDRVTGAVATAQMQLGALAASSSVRLMRDGTSPLHVAVEQGNLAAIQTLLQQKADPGLENKGGLSPLMIAMSQHDKLALRLLLKYHSGESAALTRPLRYAIEANDGDAVRMLLAAGADGRLLLDFAEKRSGTSKALLEDLRRASPLLELPPGLAVKKHQ